MNFKRKGIEQTVFFLIAMLSAAVPFPALADISLLKKSIVTYNLDHHKKSLSDGSYRGEEGILRINPEVGRSFGFNVQIDQDYLEAKELYREADKLLEKAVKAMATQKKEEIPGEHVKKIGELATYYNTAIRLAQKKLMNYRTRMNPRADDRLNEQLCSDLLEGLLQESLKMTSNNLRDALGHFYNRCQNLNKDYVHLNTENIRFVNYVFYEFTDKASENALKRFDLDKDIRNSREIEGSVWRHVLGETGSRYISFLESVLEKHKKSGYSFDPLLFMALIRQESNFDPRAVSSVGAVGLTQIMPETAKSLGVNKVFKPAYFEKARSFLVCERRLRHRAMGLIRKITDENMLKLAKNARELMQESLRCRQKRKELYAKYKRELLRKGTDDRLNPHKAIKYGFKYFSNMMKIQHGDISLALASYNAGPHRVKQYKGIPPYEETISFRNKVLKYYRDYVRKLGNYQTAYR